MRKEFKTSMALHLRALKIQIVATILMATLAIIVVALGNEELEYYYVPSLSIPL